MMASVLTAVRLLVTVILLAPGSQTATTSGTPQGGAVPGGAICPGNCTCRLLGNDTWDITCKGVDGAALGRQLPLLPKNTARLTLVAQHFNDLSFPDFPILDELILADSDPHNYLYQYTNFKANTFDGLQSLKSLAINVIILDVPTRVLAQLVSLTKLDLSNTRNFRIEKALALLNGLPYLPIEDLRLRNIQHSVGQKTFIDLNHLFRALSKFPIRRLDISENGFVDTTPGFNQFLPRLEEFISSHNVMGGENTYRYCSFWDILIHPSVRHIDVSHQGNLATSPNGDGRRKRHVAAPALRHPVTMDTALPEVRHLARTAGGDTQRETPSRQKRSFWTETLQFNNCFKNAVRGLTNIICNYSDCLCKNLTAIACGLLPSAVSFLTDNSNCYLGVNFPIPPNLEVLSIHHLRLDAYSKLFDFPTNAEYCLLESELKYIDFSYNDFGRHINPFNVTFTGLTKLVYLNLQGNNMNVTDSKLLRGFYNVETLLLGRNRISLDRGDTSQLFQGFTRLRVLDLAYNGIETLPSSVFANLNHLEILNLSGNALVSLDIELGHMTALLELDLRDNAIATLSESLRNALDMTARDSNVTLDLSGNILSCSCEQLPFFEWMQTTKTSLRGRNEYYCSHPVTGRVAILDVDLTELHDHCHRSYTDVIIASTMAFCGAMLLAGLAILVYKKRWRIRFYLYAARRGWNRYRSKTIADQFTYDAFVIYNSEDRAWVHDKLRTELEGMHQLKLCIHYRDFTPGYNIQDQIVNSIDASRKTLVVLSPAFLQSSWCSFEMQMARMKHLLEGLDVLILVILRDLPVAGVDKTLARLLASKTYLKWEEDRHAQFIFWDQLVRAIRDASHTG
nr:Toll-like receptor 2 [Arenicola marina]